MSIYIPKTQHLQEIILYYHIAKKIAAGTHRLLVEIYVDHAPSFTTCKDQFCRFRNGNYDIKDKDHGRPTKEFEDKELEMLLDKDQAKYKLNQLIH